MPQSRTRTSRQATRAKYRKPKRRRSGSMGWNVAIAAVVIVGVVAVVLARAGSDDATAGGPPFAPNASTGEAGDHWHSYLAVNICGEWLTPAPAFAAQAPDGEIHSHGDGLIHTHPNNLVDSSGRVVGVSTETGSRANIGKFMSNGGWDLSQDRIEAWAGPASAPDESTWANGDECTFGEFKGQQGRIVWAVDGKAKTGDPAAYRQKNGETIAIGFLPKGAELEFPTFACDAFGVISDQNTPAAVSSTSPCLADSTTTTTAPATTTTAAPSG